jgi:dimeric dUTPase (all-alpha-NTP-PPase superfamily)
MPLKTGKKNGTCFIKWGDQGHPYTYICDSKRSYDIAKKKATAQAVAIGDLAASKISFDFDDTLTKSSVQDIAKKYIADGVDVYIISARDSKDGMFPIADELGIPHSKIFATGSNKAKIEKINELGISKHYDNNKDVIDQLKGVGELVKLTTMDILRKVIKQNNELKDSVNLKVWRSTPNSSNVKKISYNDESKEMVIKFTSGDLYTYYDVDFSEFTAIFQGAGITKTQGENKYGSWDIGKSPSVGAAVYNLLVKTNKRYKKGGTLK